MKSMIRHVKDGKKRYDALAFVCPGCVMMHGGSGIHLLPVNTTETSPAWDWDGNLEKPTLSPSILTGKGTKFICHSFLRAGVFDYLGDCTHRYNSKKVVIPDLPDWFTEKGKEDG